MTRVYISLKPDEREALWLLARQQLRTPKAQATLLVRQSLEQLGLLPTQAAEPTRPETPDHEAE